MNIFRCLKRICAILLMCLAGYQQAGAQELPMTVNLGMPKADTAEINRLITRSIEIGSRNIDSSLLMLQRTLALSKRAGYTKGEIMSYLGVGIRYVDKRNYTRGKPYLDSALYYTNLYLTQDTSFLRAQVLAYNAMAVYYTNQGNNSQAIRYYYQALDFYKSLPAQDSGLLCMIYSNIGVAFMNMEQQDKSLYYLNRSRQLALLRKDSAQLAQIMRYKGQLFQNALQYDTAEYYFRRAIEFYLRHDNRSSLQGAYYGLGRNYLMQDMDSLALKYFTLSYSQDPDNSENNSSLLQGLGGVYYKLRHYDLAEQYYERALEICKAEDIYNDRLTIYSTLALIYNETGRFRKAFEHQRLYSDLFDSLHNHELARISNQLEVKYRLAEKDKELTLKENLLYRQENRIKEKNLWLLGLGSGALIVIILLVSLYVTKQHKSRLQEEVIRNLEKEREIHVLRARIEGEEEERNRLARELHDGIVVQFSAIKMNLSVLPETHASLEGAADFRKIIRHLDNATVELRRTAHNLLPDSLLKNGLSEAVFYFCKDLEQSSGLQLDFQQYTELPRLNPEIELSVYRIVQELLQNIVKHSGATKAIIQLSYNEGLLNVTVEDDGTGFEPSEGTEVSGIGIKNIYSRASAMGAHLEIESNPGFGATVYFELDVLKTQAAAAPTGIVKNV